MVSFAYDNVDEAMSRRNDFLAVVDEEEEEGEEEEIESYKIKIEESLDSLEKGIAALSRSAQESILATIREDPRLRTKTRDTILHIARARAAGKEAAAVSLAAAELIENENEEIALREIGIVAATASRLAMEESMQQNQNKKNTSATRNVSLEKFEEASEKVLRAELVLARHLLDAKQQFFQAARQEARRTANEIVEALLFSTKTKNNSKAHENKSCINQSSIFSNERPHIVEALASGENSEIEAALSILLAPTVVYARHYINLAALCPRIILVIVGSAVIVQQEFAFRSIKCTDVLKIKGVSFLPLAGWLAAQIFCDILIIFFRAYRYFALAPLVSAFSHNLGAEVAKLRAERRHRLFSTFVQHSVARSVTSRTAPTYKHDRHDESKKYTENHYKFSTQTHHYHHHHQVEKASRRKHHFSFRARKKQEQSMQASSSSSSPENEDHEDYKNTHIESELKRENQARILYEQPPHALDAIVPIEEATERGERAMFILARIDSSLMTRLPLAFLTILSFVLGLAGGIYLLLPLNRDNCQPGLLLVAYGYVVFFYIFFLPNVVVVFVACAELVHYNQNTLNFSSSTNAFHKLDQILFLGQLPVCAFLAKIFIFNIYSNVPTTPFQFQRSLHRDRALLAFRRNELQDHLSLCNHQLYEYDFLINNLNHSMNPQRSSAAHITQRRKNTNRSNTISTPTNIHRYTSLIPEIQWRRSFVPVFATDDSHQPHHLNDNHNPAVPAVPDLEAGTCTRHHKTKLRQFPQHDHKEFFVNHQQKQEQRELVSTPEHKSSLSFYASPSYENDFAFHTSTSAISSPVSPLSPASSSAAPSAVQRSKSGRSSS